ncbi:MAG: hypothetical protein AB1846_02640 [Chloroflexota bacterium]
MNWKIFFIKFFRNVAIGVVLGVVILGGFGYLLSGMEGLVNMAYWGFALGLIGGFSAGIGVIFEANFWGRDANYKMFPEWNWFIKQSDDDDKKPNF